jgi:hypothetical protein
MAGSLLPRLASWTQADPFGSRAAREAFWMDSFCEIRVSGFLKLFVRLARQAVGIGFGALGTRVIPLQHPSLASVEEVVFGAGKDAISKTWMG